MNTNSDADPMVVDAVRNIRDRFGIDGLRDLVTLAGAELQRFEQEAGTLDVAQPEHADMGDTQAWVAFSSDDLPR